MRRLQIRPLFSDSDNRPKAGVACVSPCSRGRSVRVAWCSHALWVLTSSGRTPRLWNCFPAEAEALWEDLAVLPSPGLNQRDKGTGLRSSCGGCLPTPWLITCIFLNLRTLPVPFSPVYLMGPTVCSVSEAGGTPPAPPRGTHELSPTRQGPSTPFTDGKMAAGETEAAGDHSANWREVAP